MYCVQCGVRLQADAKRCPLCSTPAWKPKFEEPQAGYSDRLPKQELNNRIPALAFTTVSLIAACLTVLIYCLSTYQRVFWSGYVMLGIAAFYLAVLLPFWFEKPHPLIFIPVAVISVCGYLLYICLYSGGSWFLSFAFPLAMLFGTLTTVSVAMFRYVKKGKLFIIAGLLFAIGGSAILVEFFEHITFGTKMFVWSLYPTAIFAAFGAFMLLAGLVRPLREYLERKFFL